MHSRMEVHLTLVGIHLALPREISLGTHASCSKSLRAADISSSMFSTAADVEAAAFVKTMKAKASL